MPLMRRRDLLKSSASALLTASVMLAGRPAHAQSNTHTGIELSRLGVQRTDDGLLLNYDARFDLPRDLEQALSKGVAVVFVAEAEVFKSRWYWTDQLLGSATRRWRLAYQPLTRRWRLSFDGLSRHYNRLSDALDAMRSTDHWRIADTIPPGDEEDYYVAFSADTIPPGDEEDYYVAFSFKLDTDELPRPLQIGLGGPTDWRLAVQRRVGIHANR